VARERPRDIAFDATFRAAAPHQRRRAAPDRALAVERDEIREKVRFRRASNLILFAVDASWSMSAVERTRAARGAIVSLLTDAYQRRDRVAMIVFRGRRARLMLPPTSSVERARRSLAEIPIGGRTPLGAGLLLSYEVLARHRRSHPELRPLLILLTDAAANVSVSSLPPDEEAHELARRIRRAGVRSVVINLESPTLESGLARRLAESLGGSCYTLAELRAERLYAMVKAELG
jgi:magnesium chelatase subunit D